MHRHMFAVLLSVAAALPAFGGERVEIAAGFDGKPFTYEIAHVESVGALRVWKLFLPSPLESPYPENNRIPAEYFIPAHLADPPPPPSGVSGLPARAPRPAVAVLHILGGDFTLERIYCAALARRGIPALWFKLPYYGERCPPGLRRVDVGRDPELFFAGLEQALSDTRRAADFLASRPEIDPEKLGLLGTSMGAIIGVPALDREGRFQRAALLLGGGNLPKIIGHSSETADLRRAMDALPPERRQRVDDMLAAVEPLKNLGGLARQVGDRRAFFGFAEKDEVIAPERSEELLDALGIDFTYPEMFHLAGAGHYSALSRIDLLLDRMLDFFARDLPAGVARPKPAPAPMTLEAMLAASRHSAPDASAWDVLIECCRLLKAAVVEDQAPGRLARTEIVVTTRAGEDEAKVHAVSLRRGDQGRFRVSIHGAAWGDAAAGVDDEGLWAVLPGGAGVRIDGADKRPALESLLASPAGFLARTPLALANALEIASEAFALDIDAERRYDRQTRTETVVFRPRKTKDSATLTRSGDARHRLVVQWSRQTIEIEWRIESARQEPSGASGELAPPEGVAMGRMPVTALLALLPKMPWAGL